MAIVVEYDAKGSFQGTSLNPAWNHTCTTANVIYVLAMPSLNNAVVSVTYNSVGLSLVNLVTTSNPRLELWRLDNPSPGTNQVYVTQTSSVCGIWGSFSLRSMDLLAGEIGYLEGSASGGTLSQNVLGVPTGGMAFDAVSIRNVGSWAGGSGQTMINRLTQSCAFTHGHWNSYEAGSGTINMDSGWNNSTVHGWMVWGVGPQLTAAPKGMKNYRRNRMPGPVTEYVDL